jgi:hypothetical protein
VTRAPVLRPALLACGVLASLVYVATDLLAAVRYPAYHEFRDQMVSELMATGAPTERLVDPVLLFYDVLMVAFAAGVWMSGERRRFRITGALLGLYGAFGLLGPTVFEMNMRGSGGDPTADQLHILATATLNLLMFAAMGFAASLRGRGFRRYTLGTIAAMIALGGLTWLAARDIPTTGESPWLGLFERVLIGIFLLWVAVLAVILRPPGERQSACPPPRSISNPSRL